MSNCDNSVVDITKMCSSSMDILISKYGNKINNVLKSLENRVGFYVNIYYPVSHTVNEDDIYGDNESIYGDYDNDNGGWSKNVDLHGKFIVTGVMNNTSISSEIIDPFYEDTRFIYFINKENPIKDSLIEVIIVPEIKSVDGEIIQFEEKMMFRLGAEDITVGGNQNNIYKRFVLYPMA